MATRFLISSSWSAASTCALGNGSLSEIASRVLGPSEPSISRSLRRKQSTASESSVFIQLSGVPPVKSDAISKDSPPVYSSRKSSISEAPETDRTPRVPWTPAILWENHLPSIWLLPVDRILVILPCSASSWTHDRTVSRLIPESFSLYRGCVSSLSRPPPISISLRSPSASVGTSTLDW